MEYAELKQNEHAVFIENHLLEVDRGIRLWDLEDRVVKYYNIFEENFAALRTKKDYDFFEAKEIAYNDIVELINNEEGNSAVFGDG